MKRRFPLQVHISTLFLILTLLVGGVIGGIGYKISQDILESTAAELSTRIQREVLGNFTGLLAPAEVATRLLGLNDITQQHTFEGRLSQLDFMRELLNSSSALTSLYVGYESGDFFLFRRVSEAAELKYFAAPEGTAYIVQSIEHAEGGSTGRFIYLDAALVTLRSDVRPEYAAKFDPRNRDWYTAAMRSKGQIKTPPYLFFTSGKPGTTIASRASKGGAVVGADIGLDTLNQLLAAQKVTPGTHLVLSNAAGQVIAADDFSKALPPAGQAPEPLHLPNIRDLGVPVLAQFTAASFKSDEQAAQNALLTLDGERWHTSIRSFKLEGTNPLFLVAAIPDQELMAPAHKLMRHLVVAMLLVIALAIPATLALARRISRELQQLVGEAESIRRFEFSHPIAVDSMVLEVNELAVTMGVMKRTIRRFLDISMAVASENNFSRLLPGLLRETISAGEAEAGILYLAENDMLVQAAAMKADGGPLMAESAGLDPALAGPLLSAAIASGRAQTGRLSEADLKALGVVDSNCLPGKSHAIAVPLLNRQHNLVGAMVLFRLSETDQARLRFIEALSGSSAVSIESKELIHAQKVLFESFIQMIAGAIDAKSPYTGGHCARVPELTKMLAKAVCAESSGPYKDFQLDEEGWEAVHVAAWLHDCGKVTTPEYVVDKATKLESLYDRIHEVRMRFEVLKRDAEIACLQAVAGGEPAALAQDRLAEQLAALNADFAFVATCNEGGEFMAPEKIERLKAIAGRTWRRTLDDRLGISHEEKARKERTPTPALPVDEPLLADKPEHRFERGVRDQMPDDNRWGFRMPPPELLYNRGELHNLGVARGTLSDEERYKINEHIIQTIIMLTQLPFPKHLRQVPEIAGGHHEKMDGTGYPKRLRREEMSPVARMMAISDIFEALTAIDRPYKKGKKLSEAISIMATMKKAQHIDAELFDIFLRAGVYREYAERFMRPEQIDEIDIEAFVGPAAAPTAA